MFKTVIISTLFFTNLSFASSRKLDFEQKMSNESKLLTDAKYFEISNIQVEEVPFIQSEKGLIPEDAGLGDVITIIDSLIALGTKVYEIVKKAKPVSTTSFYKAVSVLPNTGDVANDFSAMENWSMPKVKKFNVTYKNGYGVNVISFDYMVYFQTHGSFNGKGHYLTGLRVAASNIKVSWGFKFDASSELVAISNHGSKDNPVAGATIELNYKTTSLMTNINATEVFHIDGTGQFIKL